MFKHSTILMLGLLWSALSYAQGGKSVVKGQIIDPSRNPVEYGTISVFSSDSSLVTGAITDNQGKYTLEVPRGKYYMQVQFLGYKTLIIDEIIADQKLVELAPIVLDEDASQLDAVEVSGERSSVEFHLDKKVINIGDDLAGSGGDARNALVKLPSIEQGQNGDVSLRGSANFTVLIDGRPSPLQGNDALKQIPMDRIEKIEVMTNPSSRYSAEGTAGIINVIMKKDESKGFGGSFDFNYGTGNRFFSNLYLNYRTGKFNFFTQTFAREGGWQYRQLAEQKNFTPTDTIESTVNTQWQQIGTMRKMVGGIEYEANENNYLSLNMGYSFNESGSLNTSEVGRSSDSGVEFLRTDVFNTQPASNFETNLYYEHNFGSKDHVLAINLFYYRWIGEGLSRIQSAESSTAMPDASSLSLLNESYNNNDHPQGKLMIDYERLLGKGKLEAGYFLQINHIDWDLGVSGRRPLPSDTLYVPGQRYNSQFDRSIHAVYATYSGNVGKLNYKGGLRGEYTDRHFDMHHPSLDSSLQKLFLFPSAFLSYKVSEKQNINMSYSRRLTRPNAWHMLLIPEFYSILSVNYGNPQLDFEFMNNVELSHQMNWEKVSLSSELFFSHTADAIRSLNVRSDNTLAVFQRDNIGESSNVGSEIGTNWNATDWLEINLGLNGRFSNQKAVIGGEQLDRDIYSGSARLTTKFKPTPTTTISLTHIANSGANQLQGSNEPNYFAMFNVNQKVLKNQGDIGLFIWDVFKTFNSNSVTRALGVETNNQYFLGDAPMIANISFRYQFNQIKYGRRKKNKVNINESQDSGDF